MRLTDLDARLLRIVDAHTHRTDAAFVEADGVLFLCPKCFLDNGGPVGTHAVICWRPRVPQTHPSVPGRWEFEGTGLDDLTLVAGSSSVLITEGCRAHFFVRGGAVEMVG